ncbi:MAG: FCD domain-containing protein [Propionibacteriaceae bacterium]|nr:FCD domain-containing protein [Propionibacteriaceae bacterium]
MTPAEHEQTVTAITSGDPQDAEAAMRYHLNEMAQVINALA